MVPISEPALPTKCWVGSTANRLAVRALHPGDINWQPALGRRGRPTQPAQTIIDTDLDRGANRAGGSGAGPRLWRVDWAGVRTSADQCAHFTSGRQRSVGAARRRKTSLRQSTLLGFRRLWTDGVCRRVHHRALWHQYRHGRLFIVDVAGGGGHHSTAQIACHCAAKVARPKPYFRRLALDHVGARAGVGWHLRR